MSSYTVDVKSPSNDAGVELGVDAQSQTDAVRYVARLASAYVHEENLITVSVMPDGELFEVVLKTDTNAVYTVCIMGPDALTVFYDFEFAMDAVYNRDMDKLSVMNNRRAKGA